MQPLRERSQQSHVDVPQWLAAAELNVYFSIPFRPVFSVVLSAVCFYLAVLPRPLNFLREAGLVRNPLPALAFSFLITLPMLIGLAVTSKLNPEFNLRHVLLFSAVFPLAEEVLYRGTVLRLLQQQAGWRFWPAAGLSALAFGMGHIDWKPVSVEAAADFLITGLGGLLFCWLFYRWEGNLWAPFGVHLFMNLWWDVFAVDDTALGTWLANGLRLLSVILAIVLTLYWRKLWPTRSPAPKGSAPV